jgi:hypothetical protein
VEIEKMKMMRYIDPIIFLNFLAKEDRTYRGTYRTKTSSAPAPIRRYDKKENRERR